MNTQLANSRPQNLEPVLNNTAMLTRPDSNISGTVADANANVDIAAEQTENEEQIQALMQSVREELQANLKSSSASVMGIAERIAREVARICDRSDRIQSSGQVESWQLALVKHRVQKIMDYYKLGSKQGRVELHSNLSVMVYRHVAPAQATFGFQGRCNLIEDFLQGFYIEVLRAFRREHQVAASYTPRTRVELAEYMAFSEQYAKRRINLPGRNSQQLVILRAQGFAKGQPPETSIDIELAVESAKGEENEAQSRSAAMQQVREQMVADAIDPAESVERDRVIEALLAYLEAQGQSDCVDYLTLKLQDLPAHEIDEILGLSSRQRDYLQQRFKYHVEKFSRTTNWQLVHEWLGADLDRNLGLSPQVWQQFVDQLSPKQQALVELKKRGADDVQIQAALKCTAKQAQKMWTQVLELAWQARNRAEG
jgi:hypothetical protein